MFRFLTKSKNLQENTGMLETHYAGTKRNLNVFKKNCIWKENMNLLFMRFSKI